MRVDTLHILILLVFYSGVLVLKLLLSRIHYRSKLMLRWVILVVVWSELQAGCLANLGHWLPCHRPSWPRCSDGLAINTNCIWFSLVKALAVALMLHLVVVSFEIILKLILLYDLLLLLDHLVELHLLLHHFLINGHLLLLLLQGCHCSGVLSSNILKLML
jgi:hypothetical protein